MLGDRFDTFKGVKVLKLRVKFTPQKEDKRRWFRFHIFLTSVLDTD
jgi:hypothetical protein